MAVGVVVLLAGCIAAPVFEATDANAADRQSAALFPRRGQPASAPGRIDWKHALGLALSNPGFDARC